MDTELQIISVGDLYRDYRDAWIVVCTFNYSVDVITALCIAGFSEKNMLRATYTSNIAYFSKDELYEREDLYEGYKYAYELAFDDISKEVVMDVLWKDLTGVHRLAKTSTLSEEMSYFDFDFSKSAKEVFVQAGCYTGDTVEAFIRFRKNNSEDVIYTFEGDAHNFEVSKRNLKKYSNVSIYHLGLWEKEDTLSYISGGDARSRLSAVGWSNGDRVDLNVISLDAFFADKKELPTFIQLDVEGAEPNVLLGARNILRKAKPKLAICVYHYQDHLYKIPRIIQECNPEYKRFRFIQTLDDNLFDTVLFAD